MPLEYHRYDRREFVENTRRLWLRLNVIPLTVFLALIFAPMLAAMPFRASLAALRAAGREVWVMSAFGVYFLLVFVLTGWLARRITHDRRVRCPGCRGSLLGIRSVVVATGKCGHCGAQVLAADPPDV